MAPTNAEAFIEHQGNAKIFYFRGLVPFKNKKLQPSIDIPLVNTGPADRFIFRFTGQSQDLNFTFTLWDDGQDVSDGDSIITVKQQAEYLMDEIFTEEFDTLWQIGVDTQYTGRYEGVIDTIDLDTNVGGNIRTGTISFKRGRIGGL